MSESREHGPYRVLVIDDESDVRQLLEHLLEREAFEPETAASGQKGLDRLRENPGGFDLVLLDISMPNLDGFEVLQEIQELEDPPMTLVLSSLDRDESKIQAFELGAIDYVTKPFSTAVLVARLKRHLERETDEPEPFRDPWVSALERSK